MKELKETVGRYHRIVREPGGVYGVETIEIEKGKVTKIETVEANYPTITLSKFAKTAFGEAQLEYDRISQLKE